MGWLKWLQVLMCLVERFEGLEDVKMAQAELKQALEALLAKAAEQDADIQAQNALLADLAAKVAAGVDLSTEMDLASQLQAKLEANSKAIADATAAANALLNPPAPEPAPEQ